MTHSCLVDSRFTAACPAFSRLLMCVDVRAWLCASTRAHGITIHACLQNSPCLWAPRLHWGDFIILLKHFRRICFEFLLWVGLETVIWCLVYSFKKWNLQLATLDRVVCPLSPAFCHQRETTALRTETYCVFLCNTTSLRTQTGGGRLN